MAKSRQMLKMYHYQQVRKEPKERIYEYVTAAVETSVFSMGEYVNNDVAPATSNHIGKNEISTLQYKVRRMTSADTRSKSNSKP